MAVTKPKTFRMPTPPKPPSPPKPPVAAKRPDPITGPIAGPAGKAGPAGPGLKRGAKGGLYYELPGGRRVYVGKKR